MLLVTQAMGDDSDGQAQIMDDSGIQAKVMDMSSGSTQVNGDSAEQAQMPEDSDRQEQVMTDPTGQAKSTGDTVEQTVTSADQSPCSGMDPLLGACVEHAEGPFLLPSELEEDDEGWLWTFE
ncbi:hypothetical protein MTO96_019521 [Rhipicephalus appendiculatus]